jgi:hypothetical protein
LESVQFWDIVIGCEELKMKFVKKIYTYFKWSFHILCHLPKRLREMNFSHPGKYETITKQNQLDYVLEDKFCHIRNSKEI